jgi:dienelactone hydrolase
LAAVDDHEGGITMSRSIFAGWTLAVLLASTLAGGAGAAIKTQEIEYDHGGTKLLGYLAYDDAVQGKRPGVVVVHEWMGHNEYARRRAEQLAGLGYAAFALDMYGKGVRAKDAQEASQMAGKFKGDRKLMRDRARAGLEVLKKQQVVDSGRVAAMGYCFGGQVSLELARAGEQLAGVVSFHGALDTPTPQDAKNIKAKVLALHGQADPFVPPEHVAAFLKEMEDAKADYQFVSYGPGVVHGFTNPDNKGSSMKGVGYDENADRRSWRAMQVFFEEAFGGQRQQRSTR